MTLQELAALPVGTRVRLFIEETLVHDEITRVYDYGTIESVGVPTHVAWDGGPLLYIDSKSPGWSDFVGDMEVV